MESRSYTYRNSSLDIIFGDILSSKAEVIVSSDDSEISMGGGISGAIRKAGGEYVRIDAQRKTPVKIGDVIVSTAGALNYKYVFHTVTIDWDKVFEMYAGKIVAEEDLTEYIISHSIEKCFRLMNVLEINSIALPIIGTGAAKLPFRSAAQIMAKSIATCLANSSKSYKVELYVFDRFGTFTEDDYIYMFECFAAQAAIEKYKAELLPFTESEDIMQDTPAKYIEIPKQMNHDVFVSYSRKDLAIADRICKLLKDNNINVWIDREGIFCSLNYKDVIVDAIDASKCVIFISSANSNASINVAREIGYAVNQNKPILPIMLDDSPFAKSIRLDIADINQIDFRKTEEAPKKLLTSLAYMLGSAN